MNERPTPDSVIGIISSLSSLVRRNFRFLLVVGLLSAIGSIVWVLFLPNIYTSHCTILPAEASSGTFSLLAQVAGMGGFSTGGSTETYLQLYPIIARSRSILEPLIEKKFGERSVWEILADVSTKDPPDDPDLKEEALLDLQKRIVGSADLRQGVFKLSFSSKDKHFSAFVVNSVVVNMDHFFRENLRSEASKKRVMLETRLDSVAVFLEAAEMELMEFSSNNQASKLSPTLAMQEGRFQRQVVIKSSLFVELNRQLELAKIEEAEGIAVMKVLDRAVPSLKKSGPPRAVLAITSFIAIMVLAMLFCRYRR